MAPINGTPKNDVLEGTPFKDSIFGFAGNDILRGSAGDDILKGGEGNDALNGGGGKDVLIGEKGNDIYIVDNTGDVVREAANSGTDTVKSSVSYLLGSNQENLTLTGTGRINGTGNSLKNTIIGNVANNTLKGQAGNDILYGDPLAAISRNDAGDDVLYGGDGDDTLYGDPVNFPQGPDLTGGDDVLYGGDGNDTISGGVRSSSKQYGGNGDDSLTGNYEGTNVLYGGDGSDVLQGGNTFIGIVTNTLYGGNGDDVLQGGYGIGDSVDTLTGSSGNDQFVFNTDQPFVEFEYTTGVDIITDFSGANATGGDVIVLDTTTFTTLSSPAGGPLLAAEFASVANDFLAGGVSDDIVFSRATGNLFYNENGKTAGFGLGDQFATLTGVTNLGATDFLIQG